MAARLFHGIRFRLFGVAVVLLTLPLLAAQFISSMESFLRESQERAIGATARSIAAALSDRPSLFEATAAEADPQGEERRRIVALFAAADTDAAASLGKAYLPSEEIERLLGIIGRRGSRLWVVDTRSRVRGLWGSLQDPEARKLNRWLKPLASLVVPTPSVRQGDENKPERSQIDQALIGVTTTEWRGTRDGDVAILSAAQPIFVGDDIVGAVVVEETTASIQLLKQSAMERLLAVTLVVVALCFTVLLAFASRLAARIRKLHAQADAAIDPQGRLRGTVTPSAAPDEIGDLSRTIASVLARLRDYNAYLEAMAGRLSHELRTPVAVVRSSLDNLKAQALPDAARVYVDRAGEGVERLARLISRLSEGTRLEKLLESAERERFDLAALVAGCVEGYRMAYRERPFELQRVDAPLVMTGAPDAIAQLLDKLVENANDFAPAGTAVRLSLLREAGVARLVVENDGPPLPDTAHVFDSMVSLRGHPHGSREEGHLGLGLYIVRLVAEFHGGRVHAENVTPERGVRFVTELPLA